MDSRKSSKPNALFYLLFAIIAFGILGLEFVVLIVTGLIEGKSLAEIGSWPIHWYEIIIHWLITIFIWLCGIFLIAKWVIKKDVLQDLVSFKYSKKVLLQILLALGIVLVSALLQSNNDQTQFPQIFIEFRGFYNMYGSNALLVTIFQVIYYFVEMLLVFIMIIFFQRFGELVFKNSFIPYGSIGLMLTWGMIHFISHPVGALNITIWALVPGCLFLYSKKNFLPTYLLLVLGFVF